MEKDETYVAIEADAQRILGTMLSDLPLDDNAQRLFNGIVRWARGLIASCVPTFSEQEWIETFIDENEFLREKVNNLLEEKMLRFRMPVETGSQLQFKHNKLLNSLRHMVRDWAAHDRSGIVCRDELSHLLVNVCGMDIPSGVVTEPLELPIDGEPTPEETALWHHRMKRIFMGAEEDRLKRLEHVVLAMGTVLYRQVPWRGCLVEEWNSFVDTLQELKDATKEEQCDSETL